MISSHRNKLHFVFATAVIAALASTTHAQITIVNQIEGWVGNPRTNITTIENGTVADLLQYDATGVDKLVFAVASEAGFNNQQMTLTGAAFNGVALTQAVQNNFAPPGAAPFTNDGGTASIWYLDNPAQVAGPLTITYTTTGGQPNGGLATIFGLADTLPGVGNVGDSWTSQAAAGNVSTSLTTSAANSLVIALVENSGSNNGAGIPTAVGTLTESNSGEWGRNWGSYATGYESVPMSGTNVTPTFSTNAAGSIHVVAAEFFAAAAGPPPPTPEVILSTDFTGTTYSGSTASSIPWIANGVADPGDLTAAMNPDGLFTTTDAQGRFAPNRNIHNEGPWSVDIPLSVGDANIELDTVTLDAFIYNNAGALQGVQRDVDMTLELLDDMLSVLDSDSVLDIYANSGTPSQPQSVSFDLSGNILTANEDFFLRLNVTGQGPGNNAGFDNLNVTGIISSAAVPEPASIALWSLIGLGLAGFGYRRFRQTK